jgi:4-hydroxybenzoate polyprenyltransferase
MHCYLQEMYPLPLRFPLAAIIGSSAVLFTRWTMGGESIAPFVPIALCSAAVFLLLLLLRLMDELKDVDIDRALFRDRPLPSGRVREHDIRWSMVVTAAAYVGVHLLYPATLITALPLLGFTWLMYRYFFIPGVLRENLFLNLATHNPVIPLIFLHCVFVSVTAAGADPSALPWTLLASGVLMLWSVMFAWEIARKIRAPRDENAYVTYSQLLGRGGAVALAFGAQTLGAGLFLTFVLTGGWTPWALLPLGAAYSGLLVIYARFLLQPQTERARLLRPAAEVYAVAMMLSVILGSGGLS